MRTDSRNRLKLRLLSFLAAAIILTVCSVTSAWSQAPIYREGQVVLRVSESAELDDDLIQILDSTQVGSMNSAPIYLLQFDDSIDVIELAKQLAKRKGVMYAHPNYKMDSLHPGQGSNPFGDNEGKGRWEDQEAVDALQLPGAHGLSTGQDIKVGIIDGGVEFSHPVFDPPQTPAGWDFVDDDADPTDEPGGSVSGHGTFVAGLIHLVAPDAILYAYRIIDTSGSGSGFDLGRAIERAVDDGCDIINISLVLTDRHLPVRDALEYAQRRKVAIIAAAGNAGCYSYVCKYPAEELDAFAVAACDPTWDPTLASFSNFGETVDFSAPGKDVYSAYIDGSYTWWNGTSFSTPFLTGQFALMKEIWPDGEPDQLYYLSAASAEENSVRVLCMIPWAWPGDRLINAYLACLEAEIAADTSTQKPGNGDPKGPQKPSAAISTDDASCWLDPSLVTFTAEEGSTEYMQSDVLVSSANPPEPFDMIVLGGATSFVSVPLFVVAPETNISMPITVNPTGLSVGTHVDTVLFQVFSGDGTICAMSLEVALQITEADGPPKYRLRNQPNPFNPSTTLYFSLAKAARVRLTVYDILGREVICLVDRSLPAGDHEVVWDGKDSRGRQVGSGVYLYRAEFDNRVETRKMILLK